MPGEQNRDQNEQNRKRGRDEAFSNPNVELAGLNKPAGQPGTSEDTLRKVGQVLMANLHFLRLPFVKSSPMVKLMINGDKGGPI